MAEHPSTPNYGGLPFSPWPPAPSPQPPQAHQSQPAQTPSSFSSFSNTLAPTSSAFPALTVNAGAFDANSRIPGLGGLLAPPPPPLPPDVLKQFANSPLPPPPFPPVPIPQIGQSSIPGLGSDLSFVARRSPPESLPRPVGNGTSTVQTVSDTTPEVGPNREEGELSDGELDEDSTHSAGPTEKDAKMGNVFPNHSKARENSYMSDDEGSISSYNPPSASSVDHIETPPSVLPTHPINTREIDGSINSQDIKAQAKQAILELLPYDIGFQSLVQEGIQEETLRRLYQEYEIKDQTLEARAAGKTPNASQPLQVQSPDTLGKGTGSNVNAGSSAPSQDPSGSPHVSSTFTNNSTNAAVERKDRIAQLLAMKAAKAANPQSPSTSSAHEVQPVEKLPSSNSAPSSLHGLKKTEQQKSSESAGSKLAQENGKPLDSASKKKNKAQTDLVRAKMEALKQQALAKVQAQKALSSAQNTPPPQAHAIVKNEPLALEPSNNRPSHKRPLASDLFDEIGPPTKRVEKATSEEEGEVSDVGMELDGSSDLSQGEIRSPPATKSSEHAIPPTPSTRAVTQARESSSNAINSSPPLSASATPTEKDQVEVWKAKNYEISRMRKHIAELEQRRKAKQNLINQGQSPGPASPLSVGMSAASPLVGTPNGERVDVSVGINGSKSGPANHGSGAVATPPPSSAAARAEALRKRLIRRREIQAGIPVIDAEVERTRSRLAEIQKEAELLEAALAKGLENRQQLLRELELLGVDVDTVSVERMRLPELKAIRDEIRDTKHQDPSIAEQINQEILATIPPNKGKDTLSPPVGSAEIQAQVPDPSTERPTPKSEATYCGDAELTRTEAPAVSGLVQPTDGITDEPEVEVGSDRASSMGSAMDESEPSSDEEMPEINKQFPDTAAENPLEAETTAFSPDGGADLPLSVNELRSTAARKLDDALSQAGSDGDSASVSMSDSASESSDEYEPRDHAMAATTSIQVETNEDAGSEANDDEYEPMDIPREPVNDIHSISQEKTRTAPEDREKTDELTDLNVMAKSTEVPDVAAQEDEKIPQSKYMPYDSVLKNFRSFRFNPDFSNSVPGGFRSLTYSSKIDSGKVLCATEARGEVCQDPKCEDQHFSQMGLPDDKILVEMSAAPGMDRESRNKYVNGLKLVIADLRSRGVKEFEQVASELAAYRRSFDAEQDPMLLPPKTDLNGATTDATSQIPAVENPRPLAS